MLVHNEKRSEPVEIVRISGTVEVVVEIADVGAAADVCDVRLSFGIDGKLSENSLISLASDVEHLLWDVFALNGHVNCVRIHGRA